MPDLPWTTRAQMEPGTDYLVMASHLPLKRMSFTVRFFLGVSAVRKQLAAADGLVGYTMRARPLARDYWTLSVWKDDTSLRQFMRTPPHVKLMTSLKPGNGTDEVRHLEGRRGPRSAHHDERSPAPRQHVNRRRALPRVSLPTHARAILAANSARNAIKNLEQVKDLGDLADLLVSPTS